MDIVNNSKTDNVENETKETKSSFLTFIARLNGTLKQVPKYFTALLKRLIKRINLLYLSLSNKNRIILWVISGFLVTGLVTLVVIKSFSVSASRNYSIAHTNSVNPESTRLIAQKMQTQNNQEKTNRLLENKLTKIQSSLADSSISSEKLSTLESQVHALSQAVIDMKESGNAIRLASIKSARMSEENQTTTNQQVRKVRLELSKISKAVTPMHYLPISDLPFKVVGLDFWNGKPMASIAMKDMNGVMHYRLMGQGMTFDCHGGCQNWTLEKLHADPNAAIFTNQKGQRIKVVL